jgi:hypothetical protein
MTLLLNCNGRKRIVDSRNNRRSNLSSTDRLLQKPLTICFGLLLCCLSVSILWGDLSTGITPDLSSFASNDYSVHDILPPLVNLHRDSFSACLLIKDDLDILPEWIAYHYHALKLRHLVVAVDPSSNHWPTAILKRFRQQLGMRIDEWTDTDYMPGFFVQREYEKVPSFLPARYKNATTSAWATGKETEEQMAQRSLQINNHRFRQRTFITKCVSHLRDQNRTWMAHIDTDEYIVVNPQILLKPTIISNLQPPIANESSLHNFIEDMFAYYPKRISRVCLSMPTILFGSTQVEQKQVDRGTIETQEFFPPGFDPLRFESLRWRHHLAFGDIRNSYQKVLMDVSKIPPQNDLLTEPFAWNVHQPSKKACPQPNAYPKLSAVRMFPLTINHYMGTYERYSSRTNDPRRSRQVRNLYHLCFHDLPACYFGAFSCSCFVCCCGYY